MKTIKRQDSGRVRVATINNEPSRTQQQFKDDCDVNKIIAKYRTTGEFNHLTRKNGIYADVSNITDYQDSLNKVLSAQAAFAALPSNIRTKFGNDPSQLLNFLQDPNNYDEGVELGLFEKKPEAHNQPDTIKNDLNESKNMRAQREDYEEQLEMSPQPRSAIVNNREQTSEARQSPSRPLPTGRRKS